MSAPACSRYGQAVKRIFTKNNTFCGHWSNTTWFRENNSACVSFIKIIINAQTKRFKVFKRGRRWVSNPSYETCIIPHFKKAFIIEFYVNRFKSRQIREKIWEQNFNFTSTRQVWLDCHIFASAIHYCFVFHYFPDTCINIKRWFMVIIAHNLLFQWNYLYSSLMLHFCRIFSICKCRVSYMVFHMGIWNILAIYLPIQWTVLF